MTTVLILMIFLSSTIHYRVELGAFSFALMEPVMLFISALLFTHQIANRHRLVILREPSMYVFTGIVFYALIVRPWAGDWKHGLSDIRDWFIPVLAFIAILSSFKRNWRNWLYLFVILAMIQACVGIYQHFTNFFRPFVTELASYKTGFLLSPNELRLLPASYAVGFFSHPNGFAMYLFLVLLIVIAWPIKGYRSFGKILLMLILSATLFWTYAKASLLVMLLALFVYWALRRTRSWEHFVAVSAGGVLCGGIIGWFFLHQVPSAYLGTLQWRFSLWKTAIEVIDGNPTILLIGNGMEEFALRALYPQPHNLYIYLLLTYGLPGLALILGVGWYIVRLGYIAKRRQWFQHEPLLAALWVGLIGYFLIGLVESNLMGIENRMLFLIVLACFIGLRREVQAEANAGDV